MILILKFRIIFVKLNSLSLLILMLFFWLNSIILLLGFELKSFFSGKYHLPNGEDVSIKLVKNLLKQLRKDRDLR